MKLRNRLIRDGMQAVLAGSAWLARRERLAPVSRAVMSGMAAATSRLKRVRPARDLEDLGRQWQKGFPSAKQVPIVDVTDDTVIAEIHTPCPLRGTGDVRACYRMMQYDRSVVARAGGQFIVLSSQAEPGKTYCTVAMRHAGADCSDLKAAHEKD